MGDVVTSAGGTPEVWTVVFNRRAATRWCSWLALGRYKHVRAFGYVPGMRAWIFYDVQFGGTGIAVLADGPAALALMDEWLWEADAIRMRRLSGRVTGARFGFYCVPAIKHLLGLRCGALRPITLFRHCLANGGVLIDGETGETARADA